MYIEPNSKIYICAGVPLDERFDNTYLFNSASDQIYYINNYYIATFDKYSYQRIHRGYLKVEAKADDLYGANYMTFQNTAYGNKWFYAFIKSVDYINDNVCQIIYEIDPIQTWMFDWTLKQCFVEREHSQTDVVGDNLVPENLPFGEIMYADETPLLYYDMQGGVGSEYDLCVVVAAPFDKTGVDSNGTVTGGMYSGLYYNIFSDDPNTQTTLLQELTDFFNNIRVAFKQDEIVTMFYFFKEFAVQENTQDTPNRGYTKYVKTFNKDYNGFKNDYNDNSETAYTPRNAKLYTSPYNFFTITDWQGNAQDYCYEYFNSTDVGIELRGTLSCEPSIAFIPIKYMGKSWETNGANFDYAFWFSDFPKIPWNTDGFVAWLAQTGVALAGKVAGDWISAGGLSAVGGNLLTGVSNVEILKENTATAYANTMMDRQAGLYKYGDVHHLKYDDYAPYNSVPKPSLNVNIGNVMASGAVASLKGRRANGKMTPAPNWGINNIRVSAVHKKIRKDWAQRIDQYFDMFGYACNKVKVPNISYRLGWNYVKTIGCEVEGNIPADDIKRIKDIFDSGIRFWHQTMTIGDYTQSNNLPI